MFKVTTFRLPACTQPYNPLVSGFVDDVLRHVRLCVKEALLQVVDVADGLLVNTLLHPPPDPVVDWI